MSLLNFALPPTTMWHWGIWQILGWSLMVISGAALAWALTLGVKALLARIEEKQGPRSPAGPNTASRLIYEECLTMRDRTSVRDAQSRGIVKLFPEFFSTRPELGQWRAARAAWATQLVFLESLGENPGLARLNEARAALEETHRAGLALENAQREIMRLKPS